MSKPILEIVREDPQLLIAHVPHARVLGFRVVDVKDSECWIELPYTPEIVGNPEVGVVAGGVITSLLDQSGGSAVIASLDEIVSIATLDLRIDYMKPATPNRPIMSHSHCYKVTRNVAFTRGVAYHDRAEDPIANAVGTFMLDANRATPHFAERRARER